MRRQSPKDFPLHGLQLSDQPSVQECDGKGTTSFDFPAYTPTAPGTITWTATIADVDPDLDEATATTLVR